MDTALKGSSSKEQPWKKWMETELSADNDKGKEAQPWVNWKPNPNNPSEKPWLAWGKTSGDGDPDPDGPATEMMGTFLTNVPQKTG